MKYDFDFNVFSGYNPKNKVKLSYKSAVNLVNNLY
jgi:hypothetical protein